jgi:uridine kinase
MAKLTHVIKRTGAVVPFTRERITNAIYRAAVAVGGRDRRIAERLTDQVMAALEERTPEGEHATVEEIQDVVERVLIQAGYVDTAKAYILYRDDRARRRTQDARRAARSDDHIPWRKVWQSLDWSIAHDLHTIDHLNARVERGEFADIVHESDRRYTEDISTAAEALSERCDDVRVVIIAGPSSSGKTTTTLKLSHLMTHCNVRLVPLAVDNYFYDLELHPKDEFGDYDYETPQALDLELINEHLAALVDGRQVEIPFYDFHTGRRHPNHTPMHLDEHDIILIDSLHGLYPELTASIPSESKFLLYIEPLLQTKGPDDRYIRWTDLRLMRRMERDAVHRAYGRGQTLEHWHYVRSSELRNIIPYVGTVDYIVNSSLPYELPVMAHRLGQQFAQWKEDYCGDPLRTDAFERAERIDRLLRHTIPVEDESPIPPDSLLREFIGGSCYDY